MWELRSMPDDPLIVHCDNQGMITLTKDNKFHICTKHIEVHYHFICKPVEDGKITVQYILTRNNFLTFLPSCSQRWNSRNSLNYWGCTQSHTKYKFYSIYIHYSPTQGEVWNISNLSSEWYDLHFLYLMWMIYVVCDLMLCTLLLSHLIFCHEVETI